jgi:predicted DNA-binding transcriptional regulator AlpA
MHAGPLLDVVQVAALLGRSTAHVYELCARGELSHFRDLQNAIRFDCRTLGKVLRATRKH